METAALLVKRENLQSYVDEILRKEKAIIEDLETILPHIKTESIRKPVEKRLNQGKEAIQALEAGFVPLSSGYFTKVDTKSKWQQKLVKETLATMPPEVKEIWDKVKAQGVFDTFAVTVRGGGDPLLVGKKGKRYFFIAGWLPVTQGVNLGFRIKMP